jgi:hypothetical protein
MKTSCCKALSQASCQAGKFKKLQNQQETSARYVAHPNSATPVAGYNTTCDKVVSQLQSCAKDHAWHGLHGRTSRAMKNLSNVRPTV